MEVQVDAVRVQVEQVTVARATDITFAGVGVQGDIGPLEHL